MKKFPHLFITVSTLLIGLTMFTMANAKSADENKAEGTAFLAENAKKEGVITTASGLQYKVLKEGDGASPSATSSVTVHYKGTTIDGNEFDSSYKRGAPVEFRLDRVIKGWTEGLQLMKEGAMYELYIPPELAYGNRGRLANQMLIFEIELLEVKPSKE